MNKKLFQKTLLLLSVLLVFCNSEAASIAACKKYDSDNLSNGKPYKTPFGLLEFFECDAADREEPVKRVVLSGKELMSESQSLWLGEHNPAMTLFVYEGGDNRDSLSGPCTGTQYLLDLRGDKPRMIRFGIKNACNQLKAVTWKKDRAVFEFAKYVTFTYSYATGQMTLPEDNPRTYDPLIDEDSPALDQYREARGAPNRKYRFFPPYAEEVKIAW